ncbi:MAG: cutinase family protein [Aeromicrobium sp.]
MTPSTGPLRLRAITASLILVLAAGCSSTAGGPTPNPHAVDTPTADSNCADLIVLGLRGSTQSSTGYAGMGQEAFLSASNIVDRLRQKSDTTVRLEGIDYDASRASTNAQYVAGVADGRRKLASRYDKLTQECRSSKFAFIGFSQGAQAVHEYAYNLTAGQSRNLVLIAMIADPRKNPTVQITQWSFSDAPTKNSGKVGPGPRFLPSVRQNAITFCATQDEVCNWPPGRVPGVVSETHRHFYEMPAHVRSTGAQLVAVLHRNGVR